MTRSTPCNTANVAWPGQAEEIHMDTHDDDELSRDQLETVVGGLARAWDGTWDPAELGELGDLAGPAPAAAAEVPAAT
jgi:hypothetical protein